MCLSVPARIESIEKEMAIVNLNGVKINISLQLVDDARIGDFVLVHTGYALQILTKDEVVDVQLNLKLLENEKQARSVS